MALFLYKVRKAHRWYPELAEAFLSEGDVPADPVGELQTKENKLSVWEVEQDRSNLQRIVAALATCPDKVDAAGYILFNSVDLGSSEIQISMTPGGSPDRGVNHCHRDLLLSGRKLVALTALLLR
jgi:hypothetical protein